MSAVLKLWHRDTPTNARHFRFADDEHAFGPWYADELLARWRMRSRDWRVRGIEYALTDLDGFDPDDVPVLIDSDDLWREVKQCAEGGGGNFGTGSGPS